MKKGWKIFIIVLVSLIILGALSPLLYKEAKILAESSECSKREGSYSGYLNKDLCYMVLAKDYKRYSVCKKVEEDKERCYELVANQKGDCESKRLDPDGRDSCYLNKAHDMNDTSLCLEIFENEQKDNCLVMIAQNLEDTSICEKVEDSLSKEFCYGMLARQLNDNSLCRHVTNETVMTVIGRYCN